MNFLKKPSQDKDQSAAERDGQEDRWVVERVQHRKERAVGAQKIQTPKSGKNGKQVGGKDGGVPRGGSSHQ